VGGVWIKYQAANVIHTEVSEPLSYITANTTLPHSLPDYSHKNNRNTNYINQFGVKINGESKSISKQPAKISALDKLSHHGNT
jgi:hypothetical protein